jgi:hypothetical protein
LALEISAGHPSQAGAQCLEGLSRQPELTNLIQGWRSAQTGHQFVVAGKPARCLLRERKPAVNADFEHAPAGSAKIDLCRGSQFEEQVPRRTGARLIASLAAIFDLDLHEIDLAIQPFQSYQKALATGRLAFEV